MFAMNTHASIAIAASLLATPAFAQSAQVVDPDAMHACVATMRNAPVPAGERYDVYRIGAADGISCQFWMTNNNDNADLSFSQNGRTVSMRTNPLGSFAGNFVTQGEFDAMSQLSRSQRRPAEPQNNTAAFATFGFQSN